MSGKLLNQKQPEGEGLIPVGELLTRALASYAPPVRPPEAHADPAIPISHYIWVLRRYRWPILAFVAVCTIATFIISSRIPPVYQSTATLDVDRQMPTGVVGDDSKNLAPNYDSDEYMSTQMQLIESDSVLRPVAQKYNLLQVERDSGLLAPFRKAAPAPKPRGPVQLRKLTVYRPPNTYLIQISYRALNPVLASEVANAIAASYLEHSFEIRARAAAAMSQFMERHLDDLRARMERSQMALAQFERQLNVINPEEKTSILSARLLQLNKEYTDAQADRMRKEATWQLSRSGSLESAQVSNQGDALKRLNERLNETQERFAQVKEQYGKNHPEYAKAAAQLQEVQNQIDATKQNVHRRTEVEYREAVNREEMLKRSVAETKGEFDRLNENSYKYQTLKQDAENDKKLYDELERKIKEASINSGFENRNVRLADSALPGDHPVSPNTPINVLLAFAFSTVLAIGAAVLADTLDNSISDPEQVSRELRTHLIGSLPLSRDWKFRYGPQELEPGPGGQLVKADQISPASRMLEESVRVLHSSILLSDMDRRIRTILITSASPRDGKSTTSALLATTHAQQGKKTLLIDGDLRRPSIDRIFGINSTSGLSNVVLGETTWRDAKLPVERVPNLDILPAGPPSHRAVEMVGAAIETILDETSRDYSLIIIDSAPIMNFAEPLQIATLVDGVVLVSVAGETNRKSLSNVIARLQRLRANVLGLVLNKVSKDMTESYEYYGYSSKYASRYYSADGRNS
jgi:capsular exopolysaccharide synthesis family protein